MRVTPTSRDGLVTEVAGLVAERQGRVRVAVDGPPPTRPEALAELVAADLRVRGRAARGGRRR